MASASIGKDQQGRPMNIQTNRSGAMSTSRSIYEQSETSRLDENAQSKQHNTAKGDKLIANTDHDKELDVEESQSMH